MCEQMSYVSQVVRQYYCDSMDIKLDVEALCLGRTLDKQLCYFDVKSFQRDLRHIVIDINFNRVFMFKKNWALNSISVHVQLQLISD